MIELRLGGININMLLEKLRSGDIKTVTMFYNEYYHRLCFFSLGIIHDRPAADDIATDVFANWLQAVKDGKSFENLAKIDNYLFVSARNRCFSHLRAPKSDWDREVPLDSLILTQPVTDSKILAAEILDEINKELKKLTKSERRVFELFYFKAYDIPEIAGLLGISEQTAKNLKARAVKKLRAATFQKPMVYLLLLNICSN
jgi:RNA polymerase sigma factor (sigma-70 family)